ncbi:hypothetical protein [Mycolicibacterium llatzerense]|nr:hypothetical protein [Mycolicibacterium llatzerense]
MSLLLPVLAPLGGGAAYTLVAMYLLAVEALADHRARQPAGAELAGP